MKPGIAFADFVDYPQGERGFPRMRALLPLVLLTVAFAVLFARLFALQVVQGAYYRDLSDGNRIKTEVIKAPRGIIFDRNQRPLVFNIPFFPTTGQNETLLLPAFRSYPLAEAAAHVLGYLSSSDSVGKMGIEQAFEARLSGIDGKRLIEVDSKGKFVRVLGQEDPTPGQDLSLTLDAKLQEKANQAMGGVARGAVVVTNRSSQVLALVSKPSFDPNLFTLPQTYQPASASSYLTVEAVLGDTKNQPLLNRAISGSYPPGSTFKLVTAAAGLEGGFIDEDFRVVDTGVIQVGAFSFSNWYFTGYGKTDGELNIVSAIKRSNDIFFYKLSELVGVEKISLMARRFGLGDRLGFDLEGEAKGLVPSPAWKKEVVGEAWYLGDTYHYGIGQGYVSATPLQVNLWTSVIANGGVLYQPRLIRNTTNKPIRKNFLSQKTVGLIREGMVQSCSPGGVAWPLFGFRVPVACKTGTAQHGGPKDPPHAWITLFAPAHDPQIIVTVLVESSGEGSNVAAPIAKEILEEWFSR